MLQQQFGGKSKLLSYFITDKEELVIVRQDLCYTVYSLKDGFKAIQLLKVGKISCKSQINHLGCYLSSKKWFIFSEMGKEEN